MDASGEARLVEFYGSIDEPARLLHREGRVELVRTRQLLAGVLPDPPAKVFDVGGGDGVHARWLIDLGYEVELLDLMSTHVEGAVRAGVNARVGDARSLPFESASAEAVLLLGPLYHLTSHEDRVLALREARRVLRPGGVVAVAAVSRLAVAVDLFRKGRLRDVEALDAVKVIATRGFDDTGYFEGTGYGGGLFYFHSASGLADEVRSVGFENVVVSGVEGPVWPLIDPAGTPDDATVEVAAAIAHLADADPAATDASAHLLATGTSPPQRSST